MGRLPLQIANQLRNDKAVHFSIEQGYFGFGVFDSVVKDAFNSSSFFGL
jgi:hypothetical protein